MIDFCSDEDIRDLTTTKMDRRLDSITSINGNIEAILSEGYVKDIFNICFINEKTRHTIKRAKEVLEKCKEKYQHVTYNPNEHEISSVLFASISAKTEEERFLADIEHENAMKSAQAQEMDMTIEQRYNELDSAVNKVINFCNFVGKNYNALPVEERENYLEQSVEQIFNAKLQRKRR